MSRINGSLARAHRCVLIFLEVLAYRLSETPAPGSHRAARQHLLLHKHQHNLGGTVTLPLLLAGLILDLAGAHWFSGATTVGTILIIVGAVGIAIQLLLLFGVVGAAVWGSRR